MRERDKDGINPDTEGGNAVKDGVGGKREGTTSLQSEKMFAMLGLDYIPHFHDAKIFLAPLHHRTLYTPANELTERIGRHYLFSALKQVLKIIGSLDVFGVSFDSMSGRFRSCNDIFSSIKATFPSLLLLASFSRPLSLCLCLFVYVCVCVPLFFSFSLISYLLPSALPVESF